MWVPFASLAGVVSLLVVAYRKLWSWWVLLGLTASFLLGIYAAQFIYFPRDIYSRLQLTRFGAVRFCLESRGPSSGDAESVRLSLPCDAVVEDHASQPVTITTDAGVMIARRAWIPTTQLGPRSFMLEPFKLAYSSDVGQIRLRFRMGKGAAGDEFEPTWLAWPAEGWRVPGFGGAWLFPPWQEGAVVSFVVSGGSYALLPSSEAWLEKEAGSLWMSSVDIADAGLQSCDALIDSASKDDAVVWRIDGGRSLAVAFQGAALLLGERARILVNGIQFAELQEPFFALFGDTSKSPSAEGVTKYEGQGIVLHFDSPGRGNRGIQLEWSQDRRPPWPTVEVQVTDAEGQLKAVGESHTLDGHDTLSLGIQGPWVSLRPSTSTRGWEMNGWTAWTELDGLFLGGEPVLWSAIPPPFQTFLPAAAVGCFTAFLACVVQYSRKRGAAGRRE